MSKQRPIPLEFEGEQLEGVFVVRRDDEPRPTVILFPTVMGVSDLEIGFARQLAELGFNGFVADLYGKQYRGADRSTASEQMKRVRADREALRRRLLAVVESVRNDIATDANHVAVAGYCFGGLCALDVARSGADVSGAVSFHGLLDGTGLPPNPIHAKVVAFHGWDDPMAPPDKVEAFAKEMTEAGADWQLHAFGKVRHGFTNPGADTIGNPAVRYDAVAAERSWSAFVNFLEELFGDNDG